MAIAQAGIFSAQQLGNDGRTQQKPDADGHSVSANDLNRPWLSSRDPIAAIAVADKYKIIQVAMLGSLNQKSSTAAATSLLKLRNSLTFAAKPTQSTHINARIETSQSFKKNRSESRIKKKRRGEILEGIYGLWVEH